MTGRRTAGCKKDAASSSPVLPWLASACPAAHQSCDRRGCAKPARLPACYSLGMVQPIHTIPPNEHKSNDTSIKLSIPPHLQRALQEARQLHARDQLQALVQVLGHLWQLIQAGHLERRLGLVAGSSALHGSSQRASRRAAAQRGQQADVGARAWGCRLVAGAGCSARALARNW